MNAPSTPSTLNAYFFPRAHRTLIWQFVRRDIRGRYRGSLLGLAWALVTPLAMLAIYTFVFVEVFQARWAGSGPQAGNLEFALQVFAGLIVYNLFTEVISRAPNLVLEQPNLVKKVVFPLLVLPWVSLLAALFQFSLNLAVLLAAVAWTRGGIPLSALALPLVMLPFLPLLLGLAWFLAATGVYVRDTAPLIGMVMTGLMFMTPVFYSQKALPAWLQLPMQLNPPTVPIEQLRRILLDGLWPDWGSLGLYAVAAGLVAYLGARWFQLVKRGFADVL